MSLLSLNGQSIQTGSKNIFSYLTPLQMLLRISHYRLFKTAHHLQEKNMQTRFQSILSTALATALILASSQAQAFCGFFAGKADASLFNEASQVILVRDGKHTVISMLNDFKGPLTDFALVVPIPQVLEKGQVRIGNKRLFDRLDAYSAPRLAEYHDPDPCPVGQQHYDLERSSDAVMQTAPAAASKMERKKSDKALGVTVEDSYTVGEYDIVMLSAKQSDGLETWLVSNGYKMPKGAAAALKPYVAQNMKFFVAKVNLEEQSKMGTQYLRPLQFAFDSEKFMLPIRLGMINADPKKPQDLIAYVLTKKGRVESQNYRTIKLPANENLPPAIKKDFNGFYKAMFDHQAKQENHRVVFTEYFWDMGWCDPCADDPLSREEMQQAGVFWLDGDVDLQNNSRNLKKIRPMPAPNGGAQNALLTRLHVRYTPKTFPEDLMFVQTADRQNWQTRYVVQNPFEGSVQQCREKAASYSCENACQDYDEPRPYDYKKPNSYPRPNPQSCIQACRENTRFAVDQARRYYETELPQRQQTELQTLSRYTGWSMQEAQRFIGGKPISASEKLPINDSQPNNKWWEKLFNKDASKP
jgi:hypothetical protein